MTGRKKNTYRTATTRIHDGKSGGRGGLIPGLGISVTRSGLTDFGFSLFFWDLTDPGFSPFFRCMLTTGDLLPRDISIDNDGINAHLPSLNSKKGKREKENALSHTTSNSLALLAFLALPPFPPLAFPLPPPLFHFPQLPLTPLPLPYPSLM